MEHPPSLEGPEILERGPFSGRAGHERQELEAEAFAAEFLAPRWLFAVHLGRQGWSRDDMGSPATVYQLSLRIGAGYDATCRALARHGLADPDTMQDLLAAEPGGIKRGLLRGHRPDSGRGDVWLLTERDEEAAISGSPGDLFVLRLRERSGAGYLWDLEALGRSGFAVVLDEREDSQGDSIGGGLTRLVVVEPDGAQSGDLRLAERRPWMPQDRPLASLTVSYDLSEPESEGIWRGDQLRQLEST